MIQYKNDRRTKSSITTTIGPTTKGNQRIRRGNNNQN